MKTTRLALLLLTILALLCCSALAEQPVRMQAETQPLSIVSDAGGNSDRLLQAYVDKLSATPGSTLTALPRYSGSRLSERDAKAYNLLLSQIQDVANGQRASTVFECALGDLGFPSMLTAVDLGVGQLVADGALSQEAIAAINRYCIMDLDSILTALLADCPYAMYWCDKTQGVAMSGVPFAYDSHGIYFYAEDTITFWFPVVTEYALDSYTFDVSVPATIQSSVSKAAAIVAQYAHLSDYEKLSAYRSAICSLTSYNDTAAGGNVDYGNPWQLIWVFDEDPATQVVCEGYAKAFQYLCSLSDFDGNVKCWSVTGYMDGGAHMWNLVRMPNDKVYLADVTNSEDDTIGGGGQLFLAGCYSGDPDSGYVFRCFFGEDAYMDCTYVYDRSIHSVFSRAQLTVSPAEYLEDDQTAVDDGEFDPAHWQYTATSLSVTITGYTGPGGDVVIPHEIDGLPVIAIADKAFSGNTDITGVIMRDGLVSIGDEAFYKCTSLKSVTIPGSVMQMGDYIFQRCTSLEEVSLGEGLERVGAGAFCDCTSLASVTIPSTVTTIGGSAFFRCTALTEMTIPAGVTLIEPTYFGYFNGCTSLGSIQVASGNTVYKSVDGVLYSKDGATLLCCPPGRSGAFSIPASVTRVDGGALYGCAKLNSVTLPEGLLTIGMDAFFHCESLQSVTLPSTVHGIGVDEGSGFDIHWGNPFVACPALENVHVANGNERFSSVDGVLFYTESFADGTQELELAIYPPAKSAASYAVPQGVNRIGSSAFYEAVNLRSVTFPDSVTSMLYNAFRGCSGLESVELPEGLKKLGESVFYDCTSLRSVTFPDSVSAIGEHIFDGCTAFEGVYCSEDSFTANWALANGYAILSADRITEGDWVAMIDGDVCTIIQYTGSETELVIPETVDGYPVTGIAAETFRNNISLVSLSIPDAVSFIGNYAFAGCSSLVSIDLPDSLTAISDSMLHRCTSLQSLVIPQNVTVIEGWSIQDCTSLQSIIVPDSVTRIGPCAFHSCFSLTEVTLSQNLESLGSDVFSDCRLLRSLLIPDSVKEIGVNAFEGCEVLTLYCTSTSFASQWADRNSFGNVVLIDLQWAEPVYEWAEDYSSVTATLRNIYDDSQTQTETVLTHCAVGKSPTQTEKGETLYTAEFENEAFTTQTVTLQNIPALSEMELLILPESVTQVGDEAFLNLSIQGVIIPAECETIGARAFAGCTEMIYVQASRSTVFAEDAFEGCGNVLIDYVD